MSNGAAYVIGYAGLFGFLHLFSSWKKRQKLGKWSIIDQVLDVVVSGCRGCGLASWAGYCKLWVRVLSFYMVWSLSIRIFSLSASAQCKFATLRSLPVSSAVFLQLTPFICIPSSLSSNVAAFSLASSPH